MSDVILYEGGKKRKLTGVSQIETDTKGGGTCIWMCEDDATFEPIEITENGDYLPAFAYNEVDVDVKEKVSDWDVFIDEWGFPHIELDDLDLSFDFDGMPDLDGVDFDLDDIDFGDFDFDSDFDISLDDLDLDLSGLDLDGLDLDLSLDLDTLDLELHELPDEIRIMHVPNKTSYKEGEEIDLDGLVVQAYRNGEVWEDEEGKYVQGYIPVHELSIASASDNRKRVSPYLRSIGIDGIPIDKICDGTIKMHSKSTTSNMEWFFDIGEGDAGIVIEDYYGLYAYGIVSSKDETKTFSFHYITLGGNYKDESTKIQSTVTDPNYFEHEVSYYMTNGLPLGGTSLYHYEGTPRFKLPQSVQIGLIAQEIQNFAYYILYREEPDIASVTISWSRPHDNKILTASFDISVEEGDA